MAIKNWRETLGPLNELRRKQAEEEKQTEATILRRLEATVEYQLEMQLWEKELAFIATIYDTGEKLKRVHKHEEILKKLIQRLKDGQLTPLKKDED